MALWLSPLLLQKHIDLIFFYNFDPYANRDAASILKGLASIRCKSKLNVWWFYQQILEL